MIKLNIVFTGLCLFLFVVTLGVVSNSGTVAVASSCAGEVRTPVRNFIGGVLDRNPVRKLGSVLVRKPARSDCSGASINRSESSSNCSGARSAVNCSGN